MNIDKLMNLISDDLQINAMPFKQYCYEVKATHQIIRKHLKEQLLIHNVVVPKGTLVCDCKEPLQLYEHDKHCTICTLPFKTN